MDKKSEAILDFVLAFIAIVVLVLGITRIWVWFNVNYAGRQLSYQSSRLLAGKPRMLVPNNPTYNQIIGSAGNTTCPSCEYQPIDLTEDWVFNKNLSFLNDPKYHINPELLGGAGRSFFEATDCQEECNRAAAPDCWKLDQDNKPYFYANCVCAIKCECLNKVDKEASILVKQIEAFCGTDAIIKQRDGTYTYRDCADCNMNLCGANKWLTDPITGELKENKCGQVCQLHKNADDMRRKANCKPWKITYWFDWGKSCRQMKRAAAELDNAADDLAEEGDSLIAKVIEMHACCTNFSTVEQQQLCLQTGGITCVEQITGVKKNWQQEIDYLKGPTGNRALGCSLIDSDETSLGETDTACELITQITSDMQYCHSQQERSGHYCAGCVHASCNDDNWDYYYTPNCNNCISRGFNGLELNWKNIVWRGNKYYDRNDPAQLNIDPNYVSCMNGCCQARSLTLLDLECAGYLNNPSDPSYNPTVYNLCVQLKQNGLKCWQPLEEGCDWSGLSGIPPVAILPSCGAVPLLRRLEEKLNEMWDRIDVLQAYIDENSPTLPHISDCCSESDSEAQMRCIRQIIEQSAYVDN